MDDMTRIKTVLNKTSKITIPWLFVHGTEDDVVPIRDSREIFNKADNPKKLIEIQDADHVFSENSTNVMVTQVVSWIDTQFLLLT
jgi:dipeptidyl aminopeptidase/acylaminoacyl peptidase